MTNFFRLLVIVATLAIMLTDVSAATYYIDYVDGDDSNDGTTTSTPWKRHPRMRGFTGTYAHVSGDRYIFKGGVTWPNSCFQMRLIHNGTVTDWDYFGVDEAWYTGGAFTRPIFDFENTKLAGSSYGAAGVLFDGGVAPIPRQYITFDRIELKRHCAPVPPEGTHGGATICLRGNVRDVLFTNLYVHSWTVNGNPFTYGYGGGGGGIHVIEGGGTPVHVVNCTFTQDGITAKTGRALYGDFWASFNTIHATPNAINGSGRIWGNQIYNIPSSTDDAAHENGLLLLAPSLVAFNFISNCNQNAIYAVPNFSFGGSSLYNTNTGAGLTEIYCNFIVDCRPGIIVEAANSTNAILVGARVWNNTIISRNGYSCITSTAKQVGTTGVYRNLGWLEIFNNDVITDSSFPIRIDPLGSPHYVDGPGIVSNLVRTVFQAYNDGARQDNNYAPISTNSPTVAVGVDLIASLGGAYTGPRPTNYFNGFAVPLAEGGEWDIGSIFFDRELPSTEPPLRVLYINVLYGGRVAIP